MDKAPEHGRLSVVVPVYNEETAIDLFVSTVTPILKRLGLDWELFFVNDGSVDGSERCIDAWNAREKRIKGIHLSRNFGKEYALTAGLDYAAGDAVIVMDVDLQDPPELIPEMVNYWRQGFDIVYGRRISRATDPWLKRWTARMFYSVMHRLSEVEIPENVGDFRLMSRRVVEAVTTMPERQRFMKGIFSWVGFRSFAIDYDRPERATGRSKWSYWRLWNLAIEGITSFSTVPLRISLYLGILVAFLAFSYLAFLILHHLVYGADVPGYSSIMAAVLFLGGVQLFFLGVIGEYIGRIYNEIKRRPLYIVRKLTGTFTPPGDSGR